MKFLNQMQDRIATQSKYFGIPCQKSPIDFWTYQEIFWETKPDTVIELGSWYGGSALAFAHLLDALGKGQVISVDPATLYSVKHPRIQFIQGEATEKFQHVRALSHGTVLVIEDSSHEYKNTLEILDTYSPLVTPGSYFIVEDTICHHGLDVGPFPGPYEAVEMFLSTHPEFSVDTTRESFGVSWNPRGYLRRAA